MTGRFKRGERVVYAGSMTPYLIGKRGVVGRLDQDGWVRVHFDEDPDNSIKCAPVSLAHEA